MENYFEVKTATIWLIMSLKEFLNWKHYLSSFYEQVNTRKETGKFLGLRLYAPSKLDASFFSKHISKLFAVWRLLMNCSGPLQRSLKRAKQNLNQLRIYKRKRIPRHFQKLLMSMHQHFFSSRRIFQRKKWKCRPYYNTNTHEILCPNRFRSKL